MKNIKFNITKFEEKYIPVPETGCWIYDAGELNNAGYARFSFKSNKYMSAHRASYQIYKGDIPKGLYVCHTCDIKCCVNPAHLFLGTHKQNMKDMTNKKRQAKGTKIAVSKYNEEFVNKIRNLYATGKYTQVELSKIFNTHQTTISGMVLRKTWKHI